MERFAGKELEPLGPGVVPPLQARLMVELKSGSAHWPQVRGLLDRIDAKLMPAWLRDNAAVLLVNCSWSDLSRLDGELLSAGPGVAPALQSRLGTDLKKGDLEGCYRACDWLDQDVPGWASPWAKENAAALIRKGRWEMVERLEAEVVSLGPSAAPSLQARLASELAAASTTARRVRELLNRVSPGGPRSWITEEIVLRLDRAIKKSLQILELGRSEWKRSVDNVYLRTQMEDARRTLEEVVQHYGDCLDHGTLAQLANLADVEVRGLDRWTETVYGCSYDKVHDMFVDEEVEREEVRTVAVVSCYTIRSVAEKLLAAKDSAARKGRANDR